jgi:hypothetical protein
MGIRFHCHHCQTKLNIKAELAGKRAICPHCDGRFRIPLNSQETSEPLDTKTRKAAAAHTTSSKASSAAPALARARVQKQKPGAEVMYLVRPPSGGIYGPADLATIEQWVAQKRVTADTYLAPVGTNDWQSAPTVLPISFESNRG